jgi:phenylpropionate dioxygenase-like ring-hydroxylating dioxygenase large terminal subunit
MTQRESVDPRISNLAEDLDQGFSLPASWYTDPAIVELERERIFMRSWQYVGRTAQVTEVGDYFTATVLDLPVVVVRGEQGLRAFLNVCRHRRHLVMSGAGNKKVMQCPYHAWTYGLDGCLRAAPRSDREQGFDKGDFPLLPLRLDTWGPWIFVNVDPEAEPLERILGQLPSIVAQSGLDPTQLRFWHRKEWEVRDANWKAMLENYLECYHCPTQHPGFSAIIDVDPDTYALQPHEWFLSQIGPVRQAALDGTTKKELAYDPHGPLAQSQYHFLWPNITISINPGFPNLSIEVWHPDGPGRTRGFSEQYFGPDVPEDFAREMMAFDDQVGAEDDALTDSVQRGLRAGIPVQGRFLVESEQLVIRFQRMVLSALS